MLSAPELDQPWVNLMGPLVHIQARGQPSRGAAAAAAAHGDGVEAAGGNIAAGAGTPRVPEPHLPAGRLRALSRRRKQGPARPARGAAVRHLRAGMLPLSRPQKPMQS